MPRVLATLLVSLPLLAENEQWHALEFLEGTWEAKTAAGRADASGSYQFQKQLGGHLLARFSSSAKCTGPAGYDCDHRDLLYIFEEAAGQPLKAIYFDNEGHVIHYSVSAPSPATAVLISDPSTTGPQYRLVYERKGEVMEGRFEMRTPSEQEWTTYLKWSGRRVATR